jgi:hypothetical protein
MVERAKECVKSALAAFNPLPVLQQSHHCGIVACGRVPAAAAAPAAGSACGTRLRAGECGREQTALAAVECGRSGNFSTEVSSMDVREFVKSVLADAKIHRSRCKFKQFEEDYAHVVIHGDVSSAEFTVLKLDYGLVWVEVSGVCTARVALARSSLRGHCRRS